uniref:hypothetical protein n=1 Tax=Methylomonas koyamae TaxID=702114 RepID=UPI0006D028DA|nr:hypothetical protein [Methylomonas koyamae]
MPTIDLAELAAAANGFVLHFLAAVALSVLFGFCYLHITPYAEFKLIREARPHRPWPSPAPCSGLRWPWPGRLPTAFPLSTC